MHLGHLGAGNLCKVPQSFAFINLLARWTLEIMVITSGMKMLLQATNVDRPPRAPTDARRNKLIKVLILVHFLSLCAKTKTTNAGRIFPQ
jgi:hypothetical protein